LQIKRGNLQGLRGWTGIGEFLRRGDINEIDFDLSLPIRLIPVNNFLEKKKCYMKN